MATIQIVLEAINAATKTFNEVADELDRVAEAEIKAAEGARALNDEQLRSAQAATDAIAAYSRLREETQNLAGEAAAAGAATSALKDETLTAANAALAARAGFEMFDMALVKTAVAAVAAVNAARALVAEQDHLASSSALTAAALEAATVGEVRWSAAALAGAAAANEASRADHELAASSLGVAAALRVASDSMSESAAKSDQLGTVWRGFGRLLRGLNIQIPLFGGLLDGLAPKFMTQIGIWHLAADAALEIVAVWGPAIAAVGAFAFAAEEAAHEVMVNWQDMHAVFLTTGIAINPLVANLDKLHDAVRPQVYQLFGDALTVLTAHTGELNAVVTQTGKVLDDLGARAAIALQSSGMSQFMAKAVVDVRLLGTAFGNLFGIVGNLIRMNQGWATVLLQVGTGFLGLVEHVTALLIPLGQLAVYGHGFIVWVGLAVTAAVKFGATILGWGASLAATAGEISAVVGVMSAMVAQEGLLGAATLALEDVNPATWVFIAVGAMIALTAALASDKDAVESWYGATEKAILGAKNLTQGSVLLAAGLTQATAKLGEMAQSGHEVEGSLRQGGQVTTVVTQQYREMSQVQQTLAAQQQLMVGRVGALSRQYGGSAQAMALLNVAGITMTQMLTKGAAAWALIKQEVAAAAAGFAQMGYSGGVAGTAMTVMNKQATDTAAAIQKVNQAMDTWVSQVTATQTTFDSFAQGMATMASSASTFSFSLGALRLRGKEAKVAIDSLTPSGLALNQAFTQQIGTVNQMADSWRQAGLSQNIFRSGLAAAIAPLEKYARGSQEATNQLMVLAQEAGYHGPASLSAMNSALGITGGMLKNSSGDMQTLKNAANQATAQEALLTGAMQAQGNAIAGQLIGDINAAILAYNGVAQAATAYGRAVAQSGRDSDAAHAARQTLVNDMVAAGKAAGDGTDKIAAMISKVLGIPKSVAMQLIMTGSGTFSIQGSSATNPYKTSSSAGGAGISGRAAGGMYVAGGSGTRADDVLAAVSHNELIVPSHMVSAGEVDHLRGRIPGFAGGGLVLAGNTSVLSGDYAVNNWNAWKGAAAAAMESKMLASARAAGARFADGGVVGGPTGATAGQAPYGGLFVQAAVVQGFSGGLEQLHTPLVLLVGAVRAQTSALKNQTTATTAATSATSAAGKATASAKAKPLTKIQVDEKKIAADKANANMLASHIKIVEQAIKDTPAKNKAARANEEKVLKELQAALKAANRKTGGDEAALRKETIREAKATISAMHAQIAAINKLLASGGSATSKNALWGKLAADEHALAAAQATLARVLSGGSGGSSKGKITATVDKGSLAALQAGEVRAFNTAVAALRADIAKGGTGSKLAASDLATLLKRQAAEVAQYQKASADRTAANMSHLLALIHQELSTSADKGLNRAAGTQMASLVKALNKLDSAIGAAGFTTHRGGSAKASAGSSGYSSSGVVVDRKAETDLAAILSAARTEVSELKQVVALLGAIKKEADPAAQAKAIGPAVAQALNAAGRGAANAKTTRKG